MRPRLRSWIAAALSCGAVAGCGGSEKAPDPGGASVRGVEELGVMAMSPLVRARDGGYSAWLWGRSVWVYGDTVLSQPDEDGLSWHHNSFSFTEDRSASGGITGFAERPDGAGAPRHVLAPTPSERAFNFAHMGDPCDEPCGARYAAWPQALVDDPVRGRALLFYGLIYAEPGDFNFRGVGGGIAVWERLDADPVRSDVAPGMEHPTLTFAADEPNFGAAAFKRDDDLLAFGCVPDFVVQRCRLGRAPIASALDRAAWRFWDGRAWVADWRSAAILFDGAAIMSIGFNQHVGAWTAIYAVPLTRTVVMRTAPDPTGPWSAEQVLFAATTTADTAYDLLTHPEYEEENGRVLYLTHSRPTGVLASEMTLYRLELD
jgi:hypothetical protein